MIFLEANRKYVSKGNVCCHITDYLMNEERLSAIQTIVF